jgi:UTP-glucose-1-phosphate uridylyltransferase
MFQPTLTNYTEPVDFVVGKYFVTPQVFEELARVKNVKPYEFSTALSIPTFSTARQDYHGVMTSVSFSVRIYKAGTNVPYIDGTSYTWNALNSTAPKPSSSTASSKLYIFSESPLGNIMRFFTRLEL